MEQNPSLEANRFLASQEIPQIFWDPKVHGRIYKCPPPVPILSQIGPIHVLPSHFLKIYLNITLPLSLGLPSGLFLSGFPTKPCVHLSFPPYVLRGPAGKSHLFCSLLYCNIWPVLLYNIIPHYLIKGKIFWKKVIEHKTRVLIFPKSLSKTFLIIRRIQPNILINAHKSSCKEPAILVVF